MNAYNVTIPKALSRMGDLVLVPCKEYESFLEFKKITEFTPTMADKRALRRAERNLKKDKTLSYNELVRKLGVKIDDVVFKALKKISTKNREALLSAIKLLVTNPYYGDLQKMQGEENSWRRRVGSYRIFYKIQTEDWFDMLSNFDFFNNQKFDQSSVGSGFVVKVTNSCKMGASASIPSVPSLPN